MGKNGRPVPGSRAEVLLVELIDEVKGLRADLAKPHVGIQVDPIAREVGEALSLKGPASG